MKYLYIVTIKPVYEFKRHKVAFILNEDSITDKIVDYYRTRFVIVEKIEKICKVNEESSIGPIDESFIITKK